MVVISGVCWRLVGRRGLSLVILVIGRIRRMGWRRAGRRIRSRLSLRLRVLVRRQRRQRPRSRRRFGSGRSMRRRMCSSALADRLIDLDAMPLLAGRSPKYRSDCRCWQAWLLVRERLVELAQPPSVASEPASVESGSVYDNTAGRDLLSSHFGEVLATDSNIVRTWTDEWGTHQIRESIFAGPNGVLKFESSWEVTSGGFRLETVIPFGGG